MPEGVHNGDQTATSALATSAGPSLMRDLYDRYLREIVAFARARVGEGPPEPDDVAHEAFARIASHPDPTAIHNKRAFLYRTAANLITDYARHAVVTTEHAVEEKYLNAALGEVDNLTPENVLLGKERFGHVMAALKKMPAGRRRLLLLHVVEGQSYTAAGAKCGVSPHTARRRIIRALKECRDIVRNMDRTDDSDE